MAVNDRIKFAVLALVFVCARRVTCMDTLKIIEVTLIVCVVVAGVVGILVPCLPVTVVAVVASALLAGMALPRLFSRQRV
jgi:hypothetical protein